MDYYIIVGMVVISLIAIISFLNSFKKSIQEDRKPLTDLNNSITELNANFKNMLANDETRDKRISKHG